MVRDSRIKHITFTPAQLTSDSAGSFSVFSDQPINGTIQSIEWDESNYTTTGSILVFASGLGNSGTGLNGQIMNVSGVSIHSLNYPSVLPKDIDGVGLSGASSVSPHFQHIVDGPIRIVGSGCGATKSGLGLTVRYI